MQETYEFSKLKKFLTLTRFIMEDTLRGLVEDSLAKFTAFMQVGVGHGARNAPAPYTIDVAVPPPSRDP